MVSERHETEERLMAVCNMMRGLVDSSIREGMLRAVPDPVEARQIADLHMRLLQRVRAMEIALQEFQADLRRLSEVFDRTERRVQGPPLLMEEVDALPV